MTEHTNLINEILIEGSKIPGVRLWSNPVGIGYIGNIKTRFKKEQKNYVVMENPRIVKFGLVAGSCDIIGFVTRNGVPIFTAIECKVKGDTVRKHQKKFIDMINKNGGIAGVVKNKEDLYRLLGII